MVLLWVGLLEAFVAMEAVAYLAHRYAGMTAYRAAYFGFLSAREQS